LNPIAALARHPEKARQLRIESAHQIAVGHERPQPSPGARWAANSQGRHLLDPVNGQRDVQLLRLHVLRRHRVGIGRRAQQHACIRLDVPILAGPINQRIARGGYALRRREDEGRPAPWLQSDRPDAGKLRYHIGPGTRGVEHNGRFPCGVARAHLPTAAFALQSADGGVAHDSASRMPESAQVTLVNRVHIHVGRVGLEKCALDSFAAQHRNQRAGRCGIEPLCPRRQGPQDVPVLGQQRLLPVRSHHQGAARSEQRVFSESLRRILQEGAAGAGERAHLGRAITFHEQRRGAPGGVIARLGLAFEQHDAAMRGQPIADRRSGDAATDDEEVGLFSHAAIVNDGSCQARKNAP
jgi:hypothetical protein